MSDRNLTTLIPPMRSVSGLKTGASSGRRAGTKSGTFRRIRCGLHPRVDNQGVDGNGPSLESRWRRGRAELWIARNNVFLDPPNRETASSRISPPTEKRWGARLPSPPVPILHAMKRVGRIAIWLGLCLIPLGMLVTRFVGRLSDILGLGVILAAVGFGLWGVALTFLAKRRRHRRRRA